MTTSGDWAVTARCGKLCSGVCGRAADSSSRRSRHERLSVPWGPTTRPGSRVGDPRIRVPAPAATSVLDRSRRARAGRSGCSSCRVSVRQPPWVRDAVGRRPRRSGAASPLAGSGQPAGCRRTVPVRDASSHTTRATVVFAPAGAGPCSDANGLTPSRAYAGVAGTRTPSPARRARESARRRRSSRSRKRSRRCSPHRGRGPSNATSTATPSITSSWSDRRATSSASEPAKTACRCPGCR